MSPIKTPDCNFTYTAPPGQTAEQCGNLHCLRDPGNAMVISWWLPTPEERAAIANGGMVTLTSHSLEHPPVSISACVAGAPLTQEPVDQLPAESQQQAAINAIHQCLRTDLAGLRFTPSQARQLCDRIMMHATLPAEDAPEQPIRRPWYPKGSFRKFERPPCGTSCPICKGYGIEENGEQERPCPSCYPGKPGKYLPEAVSP